jgi:hypothetical protein
MPTLLHLGFNDICWFLSSPFYGDIGYRGGES